jgi:hypothetical protein
MLKKCRIGLLAIGVAVSGNARSFRVAQIPNGAKYSCANCHVNPAGGGTRNPFGIQVQSAFINPSGNVVWGSALASLDADGDVSSNGTELQDPSGAWVSGQPNPGDNALVTKPWDAASFPATGVGDYTTAGPNAFNLSPNHPNPFNGSTVLSFSPSVSGPVEMSVRDASGRTVWESRNHVEAGNHQIVWEARDANGRTLPSGIYLFVLKAENQTVVRKMLLVR